MQKNKTVLAIGLNGRGLMPCTPRKARILLKEKKAKVVRRTPFTIRLLYKTGCATQPITLGVDTGSQHIGIAIVSDDTVLSKSEYELRSTMVMHLEKSHANDAVAIAKHMEIRFFGDYTVNDCGYTTLYKQVRKKKRSLHESHPVKGRKTPNREAKRHAKNTKRVGDFTLYDKVQIANQFGWIFGFTGNAAYVQDTDGKYIHPYAAYKQTSLNRLKVCRHNDNWIEKRLDI